MHAHITPVKQSLILPEICEKATVKLLKQGLKQRVFSRFSRVINTENIIQANSESVACIGFHPFFVSYIISDISGRY